jgi:hypothetical protein
MHTSTENSQCCLITVLDKSQSVKKNMRQINAMKEVKRKKKEAQFGEPHDRLYLPRGGLLGLCR